MVYFKLLDSAIVNTESKSARWIFLTDIPIHCEVRGVTHLIIDILNMKLIEFKQIK